MESRTNDYQLIQGNNFNSSFGGNTTQIINGNETFSQSKTVVSSPIRGKAYSTNTHTVVDAQPIVRQPAELPPGQTDIQNILRRSFLNDNELNNIKIIGSPRVVKQEPLKEIPGFEQPLINTQMASTNQTSTPIISNQYIQNLASTSTPMLKTTQSTYQSKTFSSSPIRGKTYSTTTHTVADAQPIVRQPAELPPGQTDIQNILRRSFLNDNELKNIKIIGSPRVVKQEHLREVSNI